MRQIYTQYVYQFDSYFEAHRYFLEEVRYLKTMYPTNENMQVDEKDNWYIVMSPSKCILIANAIKHNNAVKIMFDKEEYERNLK